MKMTDEYIKDLLIRMAHHSTAIEGNSLTQAETASILLNNLFLVKRKKRIL